MGIESVLLALALGGPWAPAPAPPDTACVTMNTDRMPLGSRTSPLDSVSFQLDGGTVKVCYSRPSARGRTMIGGEAVPYDTLWRTGANEPTMVHTTVPITIAGVALQPGSYSLYTVPTRGEWQIVLNRSITQWGHESRYTPEVRAQEVGRGRAPSERVANHIETFTIRSERAGTEATLVLEWEHTRVRVPVRKQ